MFVVPAEHLYECDDGDDKCVCVGESKRQTEIESKNERIE